MVRTSTILPAARRTAAAASSTRERRLRKLVAENVRLSRELKELKRLRRWARQDTLTGLPNRRLFEERLEEELSRSEREPSQEGAVLVVDVNELKWVREQLGHSGGDAALQEVARVLRGALRAADLCCRTGGDEFMILLPETSAAGARLAMARLRASVIRVGARQNIPLSISIGMSSWPADGQAVADLIHTADLARDVEKRRIATQGRRRRPRAPRPLALVR